MRSGAKAPREGRGDRAGHMHVAENDIWPSLVASHKKEAANMPQMSTLLPSKRMLYPLSPALGMQADDNSDK